MGLSGSKPDFSNKIGTGMMPPGDMELEIDADMTMLDLRLKRLDKLPWDLSVLTNLQELDLSMNLYTMVPDQCIWKGGHLATSLTKLSMNQNRIGQLPNEICEMKKLHTLCCYDNSLTALPRTLHEIDNLTQLSIYNNFITELPAEFARMPKIEMAFFSNNRIERLPEGMDQLTTLKGLFLDGNVIKDLPEGFTGMRNLRELTLANNQLKAVPAEFASLTSLTELYLNGACGARPTVVPDELRQSSPARARMGCLKDCYEGQI